MGLMEEMEIEGWMDLVDWMNGHGPASCSCPFDTLRVDDEESSCGDGFMDWMDPDRADGMQRHWVNLNRAPDRAWLGWGVG